MQVLNKHVVALYASECLKAYFSLPSFKYNIIALLTDCILYMKGLDAAGSMPQRWPVQGMWKINYMSTEHELVTAFYL